MNYDDLQTKLEEFLHTISFALIDLNMSTDCDVFNIPGSSRPVAVNRSRKLTIEAVQCEDLSREEKVEIPYNIIDNISTPL